MSTVAQSFDLRVTPTRPDLAAASLRGKVEASRFVEGTAMRITAPSAPLRREPRFDALLDTEALCGEEVRVYEITDEGWAWVQLSSDGYVGYVPASDIGAPGQAPTHRVKVLRTFVYPGPGIKLLPLGALAFNAAVAVARLDGIFAVTQDGGFIVADHLAPRGARQADYVATALTFAGVPYLWGGKTSLGLDCSALVQLSLQAAGISCPRDTDMQELSIGDRVPCEADLGALQRGDVVYWKGHVGMMRDREHLVHASGHHMLVVVEPVAEAVARIAGKGGGAITSVRRIARA